MSSIYKVRNRSAIRVNRSDVNVIQSECTTCV